MNSASTSGPVVLVTGGAGYIGSYLVRELATDPDFSGYTIRIYDNLQRQTVSALMDLPAEGRYEFVEGDILDRLSLDRAMRGVSAVVHLAAVVRTPLSFDHPEWTAQVNHWGTASVAECALDCGIERMIYVSSASVYGPGGPFDETALCRPVGPYASSKRRAEEEVLSRIERGLDAVVLRLGTVFGTAPAMRFDAVADRLAFRAGVQRSMVVHGSGAQRRPLVHVRDACSAVRVALKDEQLRGEIVNAAAVNPSIRELVDAVLQLEPECRVRYTDQSPLTDLTFSIDSSKLKAIGWNPRVGLEQGLEEMLRHWQGFQAPFRSADSEAEVRLL